MSVSVPLYNSPASSVSSLICICDGFPFHRPRSLIRLIRRYFSFLCLPLFRCSEDRSFKGFFLIFLRPLFDRERQGVFMDSPSPRVTETSA